MATWYLGSVQHAAIAQWAAATPYIVGDIVRQLAAPSLNNERAFRCTTPGTSGGAEPSWTLTKGSTTNDNTVVWTEVTGNSTYGWNVAAARQRLFMDGASSWAVAGDTVYRADDHAETQAASQSYVSPGTAVAPLLVFTVDPGAFPPTAISTGATITTTTNQSISFSGFTYDYGVTYIIGSGGTLAVNANFNASTANGWTLESGGITFASTGTGLLVVGVNAANLDDRFLELINVTLSFNSTGSGISLLGKLRWFGGSVTGATQPTHLFTNVTTGPGAFFEGSGLDLSILSTGETLFAVQQGQIGDFLLENSKLGASITISSGTIAGPGGSRLRVVNCDSTSTNNRYHGQTFNGTVTSETVIVLLSSVSRKMVSNTNLPLVLDDIIFNNVSTGSPKTVTVEIVNDGVTLTDAQVWAQVEYLGTAGFPISSFADDRVADRLFGTPANQTSSSAGWVTTGLGSPVKQKLEVTFTPQLAGIFKVRVFLNRASTTLYVDPQVVLT